MKKVFILIVLLIVSLSSCKPKYTIDASDETPEQMLKRFESEDRAAKVKAEGEMLKLKASRIKKNN